jgi:hypothetical protein
MHRQLVRFDLSVLCQLLSFFVGCNVRCICADALSDPRKQLKHVSEHRREAGTRNEILRGVLA